MAFTLTLAALLAGCGDAGPAVSGGDEPAKPEGLADRLQDTLDDALDDLADKVKLDEEPLAQRRRHCDASGGEWVEELVVAPCEAGTTELSWGEHREVQACGSGAGATFDHVCTRRDADGRLMFDDGPSVPHALQLVGKHVGGAADIGQWNELFWDAAVNHDYCYHHNGASYGLSQQDCDRQMLADLSAICREPHYEKIPWFSQEACRDRAAFSYASLRAAGHAAFAAMDTEVAYPEWQPMWQKLGQPEDGTDTDLVARIDGYLGADG